VLTFAPRLSPLTFFSSVVFPIDFVSSLRVLLFFVLAEPINSLIDGIYVKPTGVTASGVILFFFLSSLLL
jgi:hypothetical protein